MNLVSWGKTASLNGPKCIVSETDQAAELRPLEELELQVQERKEYGGGPKRARDARKQGGSQGAPE